MSRRNNPFIDNDTLNSPEFQIVDQRERLIYNVTEDILVLLEDKGISKTKLAKLIGTSKSNVTQLLSGDRNMTLATLSDICFALGVEPKVIIPVAYDRPETAHTANSSPAATLVTPTQDGGESEHMPSDAEPRILSIRSSYLIAPGAATSGS